MPSEVRHLVFRQAEVVRALTDYHDRINTILPPGEIVGGAPEELAGSLVFRLKVAPLPSAGAANKSGATNDVVVRDTVLVAALILFCRGRRIPLPASASKSLVILGGQTCLVVKTTDRGDAPPALPTVPPHGPAGARARAL